MDLTPALAAVDAAEAAVAELTRACSADLWRDTDPEITALLGRLHRLQARVEFPYLSVVGEFDARQIAETIGGGGISTRAWLRHTLRETFGAAGHTVRIAAAVTAKGPLPEFGQALAAGEMNLAQLQVAVAAMAALPADTALEHREFSRDLLLEKAGEVHADDLRKVGTALLEAADPDGPDPEAEQRRIDKVRGVTYRTHRDGTQSITWRDSPEHIAAGKTAIGALDAPKARTNGSPDPRTGFHRRADAMLHIFTALLRHCDVLPNRRGRAPQIQLTVHLDTLKGLTGAAKAALATGGALSAAAVRRLACDAEITPIVIDAKGKPLSVGRRYRNWTPAIWDAMVARDTGCTGPACDVPSAFCIGHHMKYWTEHHGPTELDNGALACPRHHVDAHERGWEVRLAADGIPEWIPPPWIDPNAA